MWRFCLLALLLLLLQQLHGQWFVREGQIKPAHSPRRSEQPAATCAQVLLLQAGPDVGQSMAF